MCEHMYFFEILYVISELDASWKYITCKVQHKG
jgi:hypothetical protein